MHTLPTRPGRLKLISDHHFSSGCQLDDLGYSIHSCHANNGQSALVPLIDVRFEDLESAKGHAYLVELVSVFVDPLMMENSLLAREPFLLE